MGTLSKLRRMVLRENVSVREAARRLRISRNTAAKWLNEPQMVEPRYLEPIVHEIKVSRSDLLGDLKNRDKRNAYLDLGGQCWYVLGCNAKGNPIAQADEIPLECGVMVQTTDKLEVLRPAPKRHIRHLPFAVWMALAKATPIKGHQGEGSAPANSKF